jgi:hypothetical protein
MVASDEAFALTFDTERSIRYHDRRTAHFDLLHKTTSFFTILISGIVLLELTGPESPWFVKWFAAAAAVLGALDVVIGFSHRANQHREFKRRFCLLERKLVLARTDDDIQLLKIERSEIEADEPPVFRALDALCHNEMCMAHGYRRTDPEECAHYRHINWFVRLTANWYRWPNFGALHAS